MEAKTKYPGEKKFQPREVGLNEVMVASRSMKPLSLLQNLSCLRSIATQGSWFHADLHDLNTLLSSMLRSTLWLLAPRVYGKVGQHLSH